MAQTDGANLDTYWILSNELPKEIPSVADFCSEWLDDIGLPQYKEDFSESKIDGRLLNNFTLVKRIVFQSLINSIF